MLVLFVTHSHVYIRMFYDFLCPCDRNFAIEDNERLSCVGLDDKSRGRGGMWMCRVSIGYSMYCKHSKGRPVQPVHIAYCNITLRTFCHL